MFVVDYRQVFFSFPSVVTDEYQVRAFVNDPGLYTAIEGDTRLYIAVNLVNPDLSNINRSVLKADAPPAERDDGFRRELWFYMLLFAIVLIGFEWFTYNRGITL